MTQEDSLEALQNQWKELFQKTLPKAAVSKSPTQVSYHPETIKETANAK